jgi:DNA-binding transcriptional LysR family regulator
VVSEARFVDLVTREADLGIRARASASPVLVDRALGDVHSGLFASDAYLRQRLPQRTLLEGQWAHHDFVVDDLTARGPTQWLVERGARRFSFRANTVDARVHAARGGLGLVLLAMNDQARQQDLHHVELDAPLPALPFFLTMHKDLRKVPRVRAFSAVLFEVLRGATT